MIFQRFPALAIRCAIVMDGLLAQPSSRWPMAISNGSKRTCAAGWGLSDKVTRGLSGVAVRNLVQAQQLAGQTTRRIVAELCGHGPAP